MMALAGLGNPGPNHAHNRHNVGFMAVDEIVRRHGFARYRSRFHALVAEGTVAGRRVLAMKPMTFMNESGRAIGAALRFYRLAPADLVVIHDELDLRQGQVKVKRGGGNAGHKGLADIDAHVGPDYWRIRLGIGHPGEKHLVNPHVLKDFGKQEAAAMHLLIQAVAEAWPLMVAGEADPFVNELALLTRPPTPKATAKPDPAPATD